MDTRVTLAKNVAALLQRAKDRPDRLEPATPLQIEERTNNRVGKSTIYRILNAESYVQTDTLEAIADLYQVEAWALLTDGFDPASTLLAVSERQLDEQIEQRAAEMLQVMVGQLMTRHDETEQRNPPDSATDREVPTGVPPGGSRSSY